ncbi:hypothetical protein BD309DRAFT_711007 [Dichomitus squalens]|nr:hypothetical protein BD309DRAFT_711007 [Dichomitus squalens]
MPLPGRLRSPASCLLQQPCNVWDSTGSVSPCCTLASGRCHDLLQPAANSLRARSPPRLASPWGSHPRIGIDTSPHTIRHSVVERRRTLPKRSASKPVPTATVSHVHRHQACCTGLGATFPRHRLPRALSRRRTSAGGETASVRLRDHLDARLCFGLAGDPSPVSVEDAVMDASLAERSGQALRTTSRILPS